MRGTSPTSFDNDGGPYNLGVIWSTKIIGDGKPYYCPSNATKNNNLVYDFYTKLAAWPFGFDNADPLQTTPNLVRAGYLYYPQSMTLKTVTTAYAAAPSQDLPVWPDYNVTGAINPYKTWICVPLFKQNQIDQKRSMIVDVMNSGLDQLSHRNGGNPAGVNAAFGDGHVNWQGVKKQPDAFDPAVWNAIKNKSAPDFKFAMYMFRP